MRSCAGTAGGCTAEVRAMRSCAGTAGERPCSAGDRAMRSCAGTEGACAAGGGVVEVPDELLFMGKWTRGEGRSYGC
jgi:hypothetical protein